jgi:hypothetical protein
LLRVYPGIILWGKFQGCRPVLHWVGIYGELDVGEVWTNEA